MSEDLLSSRHIARYRYSNEDKWGGPCLYTTYIWDRETSCQYTNKTSNKASTMESLGAHQNIMVRKKVTFEKTWWMKKNPLREECSDRRTSMCKGPEVRELEESKHRKEASVSTAREGEEVTWDRAGGGRDQSYTALGCHHEEWDLFYMQRKTLKQGNDIIWPVFPRSGWLHGRLPEGQGKQGWVRKLRQFSGGTPWWLRRGWWQQSQRNDWIVWEVENTELTCQQTGC